MSSSGGAMVPSSPGEREAECWTRTLHVESVTIISHSNSLANAQALMLLALPSARAMAFGPPLQRGFALCPFGFCPAFGTRWPPPGFSCRGCSGAPRSACRKCGAFEAVSARACRRPGSGSLLAFLGDEGVRACRRRPPELRRNRRARPESECDRLHWPLRPEIAMNEVKTS
jgi:hypothetical protein